MNPKNAAKSKPSRRERSKADKMRRILTAGEKLFSKHGFDGTTVQQIADEADVAVGTLFLYISDKSELLLRLFYNATGRELESAMRRMKASRKFLPSIQRFLEDLHAPYEKDRELAKVYCREVLFHKGGVRAELAGLDLSRADLYKANLAYADLQGAKLEEANLREAKLASADLSRSNLRSADLRKADLTEANLSGADLTEAQAGGAELFRASLRQAILRRADFGAANFRDADIQGADFEGAILKTAILRETKLDGVDLSRAEGLGTALMPRGYTPPVPAKN